MNESYTDLPERIRQSFSEIDSDIVVDLRTTSEEYTDLFHRLSELKQRCPTSCAPFMTWSARVPSFSSAKYSGWESLNRSMSLKPLSPWQHEYPAVELLSL